MSHVEDLWIKVVDGRKEKTARYGKGGRYRVRWVDPGGTERSRSFPDDKKGIAEQFRKVTDAALLQGDYADPRAGKITLREYAGRWLARQRSGRSTREAAERRLRLHILPVLGDKTLTQISADSDLVKDWLAGLDGAPRSRQILLSLLSAILNEAVDDGKITRNPCARKTVKAPRSGQRRVVPWEDGRVAAIREALPPRYAAMADCGSGLGMRQGEVLALSPDDVDWLRRTVHVRRQILITGGALCFGPPKGGRERDIPLPGSVSLRLAAHMGAFPPVPVTLPWMEPGGRAVTVPLLFTTEQGRGIRRNGWNAGAWHPALEAAGVQPSRDAGFHQLRHHFASTLLAGGSTSGHWPPTWVTVIPVSRCGPTAT